MSLVMEFCFVYPLFWDFLQSEPAAKVGALIGWTRLEVEKIVLSCVYTFTGAFICWRCGSTLLYNENKVKLSLFIVKDSWFIPTRSVFFNVHLLSPFFKHIHSFFNRSHCLFLSVWPSSFVNEDMILSSSGHCVFSLLKMSGKCWPAAEWEEIWMDFVRARWKALLDRVKSTVCADVFT